jgi:hypothetical protein
MALLFKTTCAAAVIAVAAIGWRCMLPTTPQPTSDIVLQNIEALTDDEFTGKPCYSEGKYDIEKPEALVCDSPCKMKPWNTPLWGGVSYCQ